MILAENVSKYYGPRRALDDVSFEIQGGEVVGLLGLNGAGKTTALKIFCGLLLPSAGRVQVDGIDIFDAPREVRRRVGFLPERPPLYHDMSVRQMLTYAGRLNGLAATEVRSRVEQVLELAQLNEVAGDLVAWLSQGFRQRLGIAQAIVHRPALVVLDEPITGLDPQQIVGMRSLIRDLAQHHTVLISSHILGEISQTCDRLLVLNKGRLVAQGKESELGAHASATRVEALLRDPDDVAKKTAQACDGVSDVHVMAAHGDRSSLRADVASEDARESLLAALIGAGCKVQRYAEAEAGLESIFLSLTAASSPSAKAAGGEA